MPEIVEVVKVELPIAGHARARGLVTVYAEGRKHQREQPIDKKAREAFRPYEYAAYFMGWLKDDAWVLGRRVRDRRW